MLAAALGQSALGRLVSLQRLWSALDQSCIAWWLIACTIILINGLATSGIGIYGNLGDADDATRLLQVHEFLAGAPWFDTTTHKIGGDAGMLSHWSRMIDGILAGMILLFHLVMPMAQAEHAAHIVWPTVLLGSLLWLIYRAAAAYGGETAGRFALLLAVLSPLSVYQFAVGRIDHHNVMILASVGATLTMWRYPASQRAWTATGAACGLALAIGYEALAPVAFMTSGAALWAFADASKNRLASGFFLAFAAVFALAFVATIPPARWLDARCDAISLNMVALVVAGSFGMQVALRPCRTWSLPARLAVVAGFVAVGLATFGWLEPKCLAGPKGQLPAGLDVLWLDDVAENQSFLSKIASRQFGQPLGLCLSLIVAAAACVGLANRSRKAADIFYAAMALAFIAFASWQCKYASYASFIGIPAIAIAIARLGAIGEVGATTIRVGAAVLLSQAAILVFCDGVDAAFGVRTTLTNKVLGNAALCSKDEAIGDLRSLPSGLVASHLDVAAEIAVLTEHRVLAAPYHRIADAIMASERVFRATDDDELAKILTRTHVDYIVTCKGLDDVYAQHQAWQGTLRVRLSTGGTVPAFLERVPLANPQALYSVWRVKREALAPSLPPSGAAASAQ